MATASDLQQLYVGYFGRAADQEGLNFWLEAINEGGLSLDNVHASFVQSAEYADLYEGLSSSDLVAQVYLNVLGRPAEQEGLEFWSNAIDTGVISEDQLIEGLLSGLSANDQRIIANKVTVANYYTAAKGADYAEADKELSSDILIGVDASTGSVAEALDKVADVAGPGTSPDAVAAALAELQAAEKAQLDFAKAVLGDDAKGKDDATVLVDAKAEVDYALTKESGELNTAIANVGAAPLDAADTPAVVASKIADANKAAADAVKAAQKAVDSVPGLNTASKAYNSAADKYDAAVKATGAAQTEETAQAAKFDVVNGSSGTTPDAATGEVTGIIELDANGKLTLVPDYTKGATAAQKAAAAELLSDIQARLAAEKAEEAAKAALDKAVTKVTDLDDGATVGTDGKLDAGLTVDLKDAQKDQADLAKELTEFNEANANVTQWEGLDKAVTGAETALDDLGVELVTIDSSITSEGNEAQTELFVVDGKGVDVTLEFAGDDLLFIGTDFVEGQVAANGDFAGNNNALEFFLVQKGGDAEIHIETSAFGSSAEAPELNVITLTGVNVADLSFDANTGFISVA